MVKFKIEGCRRELNYQGLKEWVRFGYVGKALFRVLSSKQNGPFLC